MYAIFEDGARQYRVSVGDRVKIDWREAAIGTQVELNHVLLVADGADVKIGQPAVTGAKIVGEVIGHPSTKLQIQYFRRRKNYRRLNGHRQHYVELTVKEIVKGS